MFNHVCDGPSAPAPARYIVVILYIKLALHIILYNSENVHPNKQQLHLNVTSSPKTQNARVPAKYRASFKLRSISLQGNLYVYKLEKNSVILISGELKKNDCNNKTMFTKKKVL